MNSFAGSSAAKTSSSTTRVNAKRAASQPSKVFKVIDEDGGDTAA